MRNFKKYFKFFCGWRLVFAVIYLLSFTIVKSIENDIFSPVSPVSSQQKMESGENYDNTISEALSDNIVIVDAKNLDFEELIEKIYKKTPDK